jgi:hypothetical protein
MNDLELRVLPGEYRVVARIGNELSRAHRVVVKGGDIQKVTIDPAFDRVVHSAPSWAGLSFETGAERERSEASHGAAFAAAIDADQVAVVGIDVVHGQRVVSGALVNKRSGREFRRAAARPRPVHRVRRPAATRRHRASAPGAGGTR